MSTPTLVAADGTLLPIWGFLTFHQALRRDAARFGVAARALAAGRLGTDAARACEAHWGRYRALLEFHHRAEDDVLFPTVRESEPTLGPVIDVLAAQHDELHDALDQISGLVPSLGREPGATAAAGAFERLRASLEAHLDTEEEHIVPVMLRLRAGGPDDARPSDGGLPVPVEFAHPWSTEHLDDDLIGLALATLSEEEQIRYPDWLASYRAQLATWTPDPD